MATATTSESEKVPLPLAFPAKFIFLGWLVPGLGHFLLGLRARGTAFFVLIMGSLAFGASLHGHMPWSFSGSPLYMLATAGAMGSGIAYFGLHLSGFVEDPTAWGFDYGGAFILSAGLMNLLLLFDIHDICWGKELIDPELADGLRDAKSDGVKEEADERESPA
jgi:hypothetical protein